MTKSDAHPPDDLSLDPGSALALLRDLEWVQRWAFHLCSDRAIAEHPRQKAALALPGQMTEGEIGRARYGDALHCNPVLSSVRIRIAAALSCGRPSGWCAAPYRGTVSPEGPTASRRVGM